MKYLSIVQKERFKFYEVAPDIYAAITPYRGLCWANCGFVNKGKGLVYDTHFDLPHARELRAFTIEKAGKPPAFVVSSHYNCDHTWGNQVFANSCIIMHKEAEKERLSEDPVFWHNIVENGASGTIGERFLHENLVGFSEIDKIKWQQPDILVDSSLTIRLDDTVFEVINVAPSHSNSDLLGWLPKEKVLFTGDIVFIGATIYSEEGGRRLIKVFDYIINELKPEVVVPGHGAICGIETVRENKEYMETILEQFDKYYTDDIDPIELAKKIDVSRFLHWIQPERVFLCVNPMVRQRRGESMVPDWDYNAASMTKVKEYHQQKYGDKIKAWDPMSAWAE